jgi:uncharacterized membrane-anchored protein YitT (DUF2179 family)
MSDSLILDWLRDAVLILWADVRFKFIVFHTLINVPLAVLSALRAGDFTFAKLGAFLTGKLLPFSIVFAVSTAAGDGLGVPELSTTVWALLQGTLLANTLETLAEFGIRLPDLLTRAVSKPGAVAPPVGDA